MKVGSPELEEKTERLVRMLRDEDLAGVLINTQHNFAWLTCGGSNGIDLTRENGAGFLLVTRDGRRHVIANTIEMPRLLDEEMRAGEFEPYKIGWRDEKLSHTVIDAARSLIGDDRLGCDVSFPGTRQIEPSIARCRYRLTPEEVERFRTLGHDAGRAMANVVTRALPGQTETAVARIIRDELAGVGIYAVVTLVAGDERIAKYRHPVPTERVWRDRVLLVACARRNGLIVSLSRIICAGRVSDDLLEITESAAAVNAALYAATSPGTKASTLYAVAERAYASRGFAGEIDKHHQGGACGYRTRDWVAMPGSGEVVNMHQGFAWNPSITGTKVEESGIVTEDGFEVVTHTDDFPQIETRVDGVSYFSPGILSLSKGASA
jgi:antitoxin VapB